MPWKWFFFLNNFSSFKYCNGLSILRINESWGSIYLTATHFFPSWIILWVCKISEFTLLKQILQFMIWSHFYVSSEIFFHTPDQSCVKDDLSFLYMYPIYYQIYIKIFRSPESLRWPIAMGWRLSSCGRALTSSPQKLLGQS